MNADRTRDDGMTVVELSVVLLLLTIVSVIALGFVNSTMTTTARADANVKAERDGQLALRTITQDIRAANPLEDQCGGSYAECLKMTIVRPTSSHPNCQSVVTYRIASGFVVQDLADSGCAATRSWSDRRLIEVANAATGDPLFTYTDRLGKPIAAATSCAGNPITAPCPKYAKAVSTNLVVRYDNASPPLKLSSVASVRNSR